MVEEDGEEEEAEADHPEEVGAGVVEAGEVEVARLGVDGEEDHPEVATVEVRLEEDGVVRPRVDMVEVVRVLPCLVMSCKVLT